MKKQNGSQSSKVVQGSEAPCVEDAGDERAWEDALKRYATAARSLKAPAVRVANFAPEVVRGNVRFAVAHLGVTLEEVRRELPSAPAEEVFELPELARAYSLAAMRIPRTTPGMIQQHLDRLAPLREAFLDAAELLAKRGRLDPAVVAAIREGTGSFDMAKDGLDLARLFEANWGALQGTHPFTREEMTTMRREAEWLLDHLTQGKSRRQRDPAEEEARDLRDRLYTLVAERYEWLRRIAFYFHGDESMARVPRLASLAIARPRKKDDATEKSAEKGKKVGAATPAPAPSAAPGAAPGAPPSPTATPA
ncbi:MAG: hypothetical protein HY909_07875 [Deltaproteobacteria bacterium]|nr:hypothetical protein [Deltaproteobacteria bacterium]